MQTSTTASQQEPPSPHIQHLNDWRGETLARVRALIRLALPDVVEAVKWRGVPVWEKAGILCTGENYKSAVKLTFPKGASLDEEAFKTLILAAASLNTSSTPKRPSRSAAGARA